MIEQHVGEDESLERALKAFKKKVIRSGLFQDLRRRRFYLKPSAARQVKRAAARKRRHKARRVHAGW